MWLLNPSLLREKFYTFEMSPDHETLQLGCVGSFSQCDYLFLSVLSFTVLSFVVGALFIQFLGPLQR